MRVPAMLAILAMLAGGPAQASVTFLFVQTGSTPPGSVLTTGALILSDAAYASGISVSGSHLSPQVDWNAVGIQGMEFFVNGQSFSLADLVPQPPAPPFSLVSWNVILTSTPFAVPTGQIYFNDSNYDVGYGLAGAASGGRYNADFGPAPCNITGSCAFTGDFRRVPEPVSLGLFAGALLGLGLVRASRRTGPPSAAGADRP